ncbi:MAG TPA: hypothetical protein DCE03_02905 [Synergistaceae bacterium]|nr:MAG: Uncharacterized protein XD80_0201 [Synergistales bacterium 53_16]KUL02778.1 MAG: Uncharacterized protein XE12_0672 [Synergistales bacterium 54_9]HAA47423.1 hypothetical protein [Synergistaceae bacterium]HAG21954.1 hypothetical protein [Synergistaceae bacterium]
MSVQERVWILSAVLLTALNIILPYTIFEKAGAWAFWTILTAIVLAEGIFYTKSWKDPMVEVKGRKRR